MLLQADPTIVYGITKGQGSLGRPIRRSELDNRENPYNTYRHKGLPPTPIANLWPRCDHRRSQPRPVFRPLFRRERHRRA